MDNISLTYYRERILESIQDIDLDRFYKNNISKDKLSTLTNLVEAYCIMSKSEDDNNLVCESIALLNKVESLIKEYQYRNRYLNEGFENPFDDIGDTTINTRYIDMVETDPDADLKIGKIKLWNNNTSNKIMFKSGKMIAGQFFGKGDTIETCPVRLIYEKDLYSENIRDFAITIDKSRGIYAIPFGYASFYRNSKTTNVDPNAEYEYVDDKDGSYIRIYAINNIKKGHEIVLYADDADFENEIKPGQFDYSKREIEPYYSVKNVKIA